MLYVFIIVDQEPSQLQLEQTLSFPEGSVYHYRVTFSGPRESLHRVAYSFNHINGRSRQDCAIIALDKTSNTYYPLRRGYLDRICLLKDNVEIPLSRVSSFYKRGSLSFDFSIRLVQHLYAPDLADYNRELRQALGSSLPDTSTGAPIFVHHRIAVPCPYENDIFPPLFAQLADMPALRRSRHRVLMHSEIVAIPTTRTRLLRVQGHNFHAYAQVLAAITDNNITHLQSVLPHSDFTFFAKLPPFPNGKPTVISDIRSRRLLCQAD